MKEWRFGLTALILGTMFFFSLGKLWPLAEVDLHRPGHKLKMQALDHLQELGFEMAGHVAESRLRVDSNTLDYLEARLPQNKVQELIRANHILVRYQIFFKRPGHPEMVSAALHANGSLLAWNSSRREEQEGAFLNESQARERAAQAIRHLGFPQEIWLEKGVQSQDLPNRRQFRFTFERMVLNEPELKERLIVTVEGDELAGAVRSLIPPEEARLAMRAAKAPRDVLQNVGFLCLGLAGLGAIAVFLLKLQAGSVRLKPAATVATIAFICGLATQFLQKASLFLEWDPLWPRWVSLLRSMMFQAGQNVAILLLALVLVAAGDALDRERGLGLGKTLRTVLKGGFGNPEVGRDCLRGFLLGLICGGALCLAAVFPELSANSHTAIQPRGFFFYALNASSPALATLFFFLGIAIVEESGYRFFAGAWLFQMTGRKWLAILLPGLIYGLTHTGLDFLPPAEPFWARPLVLTLVGCVWGWGFFRFGALCVIVSHFTADLFIFNWPALGSGDPKLIMTALLTIAVPLLPALSCLRPQKDGNKLMDEVS